MIAFIRKYIFNGAKKNAVAPYIFLILCFYVVYTVVYTAIVLDVEAMYVRIAIGVFILAVFVFIERSRLSINLTSFLSPTLIVFAIIFGAVYFRAMYDSGDVLIYSYVTAVAMIALTYLKPKMLMLHIVVIGVTIAVIIFAFGISLLGAQFDLTQNSIFFVACIGTNILVCIFCSSYAKAMNSLVSAENEAKLAAKTKGSFLAKMSHEIRTPLNAILGITDTELRKTANAANTDSLQKIRTSGSLLLGIINDILDMSKIESGKFELVPENYDFAETIYDVVTLNIGRIGSKRIDFSLEVDAGIPKQMFGDSLRIKQLVSNLLSNAFKYTHEGKVRLRVSFHPEGDKTRLTFEVSDTGIGIREEDVKKLFGEYAQFDLQTNRYVEGTGLGLSICKGLVEMMDGKITAKSELGKGSVFSADILQAVVDNTPIGEKTAHALQDFKYAPMYRETEVEYIIMPDIRVLVVDDVQINLEVVAACLEPYGMQVDCVDNGADAVLRIQDGEPHYDLIFMDHMMPEMDGIEAVSLIRGVGTKYAETIPIVALTANALIGNDKMFIENGFQDFLAKPIDLKVLDSILRRWCIKK